MSNKDKDRERSSLLQGWQVFDNLHSLQADSDDAGNQIHDIPRFIVRLNFGMQI